AGNRLPDAQSPILRIKISTVANHSAGIGAEEVIFERRYRRVRRIEKILRVENIVAVKVMNVAMERRIAGWKRVVADRCVAELGRKVGCFRNRCRHRRTCEDAAGCGEPLLAGSFAYSRHIDAAAQSE